MQRILTGLKKVNKKIKDIVETDGDLTQKVEVRSHDEVSEINVDVECNPLEGPLVSELIQKLESGQAVEKIQYVEEGVYPAETAADIIGSRAY